MLFPEPLTQDAEDGGKRISIRAVNWHPFLINIDGLSNPGQYGIMIAFYHRKHDADDYSKADSTLPEWTLSHIVPWIYDRDPEGHRHVHAGQAASQVQPGAAQEGPGAIAHRR